MERWINELLAEGIDVKKITDKKFAETVELIGLDAAVKLFRDFHGTGFYVGTGYLRDLEMEYLRKFSDGKTVEELARVLKVSRSKISAMMNETPETAKQKSAEHIPMFPE